MRSPSRAAEEQPRELVHAADDTGGTPGALASRLTRYELHCTSATRSRPVSTARTPASTLTALDAHLGVCTECRAFADAAERGSTARCASRRARDPRPHPGDPRRHRRRRAARRPRHPTRAPLDPRAILALVQIAIAVPALHPRVRRRAARAHRSSPRLVRRRARRRVPLRRVAPVADPRLAPGRRGARGLPRRFVAARRDRRATRPRSGEAHHVTDFAGLAVVWLLSRPASRVGAARMMLRSAHASRSLARASSSPWSSSSPRPAFGARDAAHHRARRPGGKSTTRRRRRGRRCGSTNRSRSSLGGIRLYRRDTQTASSPGRPSTRTATATRSRSSIPKLDDGTYVVTWRVISADSHPVQGAFTLPGRCRRRRDEERATASRSVCWPTRAGAPPSAWCTGSTASCCSARSRCSSAASCSSCRGVPRGRTRFRARSGSCGAGWIERRGHDRARHRARGHLRVRRSRSRKIFDPTRVRRRARHAVRPRRARCGSALLVLAFPLLRVLLPAHAAVGAPAAEVVAGRGRARRRRALAHARARRATPDRRSHRPRHPRRRHPRAGDGLLARRARDALRGRCSRAPIPTSCARARRGTPALALGAIVALVVTGGFQAWRQVGSFDALKDTDYGQLLIAKLVVFAALIVAAAFSREVVNRRFRMPPSRRRRADDDEPKSPRSTRCRSRSVPVGLPRPASAGRARRRRRRRRLGCGTADVGDDDDDEWEDDDDESEVRRLRRSVASRCVIAARRARDHRDARERGARPVGGRPSRSR